MRPAILTLLLLLPRLISATETPPAQIVLFDGTRMVALEPVEHELSVRSALPTAAIEQALASLGFEEFRAGESLGPDHTLFTRPTASDTYRFGLTSDALGPRLGAPILDVVAALARAIEGFVSPVFQSAPDEPRTVLAPEVALRFRPRGLARSRREDARAPW